MSEMQACRYQVLLEKLQLDEQRQGHAVTHAGLSGLASHSEGGGVINPNHVMKLAGPALSQVKKLTLWQRIRRSFSERVQGHLEKNSK
jgi:hypothetical protein